MKNNIKKYEEEPQEDTEVLEQEGAEAEEILSLENHIVIYDDPVTTFDYMIETLMEICGHEEMQAMQCTSIIDSKGKCSVKRGSYKKLQPLCEQILLRKISAVIE